MSEQELKNIWKNSSKASTIQIESTALLADLKYSVKTMESLIVKRDLREILASFFGILVFTYFTFEFPFPLTKIASAFGILWFLFVIFRLKFASRKNQDTDLSVSIIEELEQEKSFLIKQKNLLNTALYWYVLPPFFMNILFYAGMGNPTDYNWSNPILEILVPETINQKIFLIVGLGVLFSYIGWRNKVASEQEIEPLLANLQVVKDSLESED